MRHTSLIVAVLMIAGVVPAAEPAPKLIAQPDAFKTLVNPQCSHCRDEAKRRSGELRDNDRVLCWIRGYSDGGAIPQRFFLNGYRVISDTYGVFVYDADAGFARGFAPSLDFTFYGWRNGVMVMKHKDGTLYSCLSGLAFDGPRKGSRLKPVPTLASDWGYWLKQYPGAVAYHMFEKYQPIEVPAAENAISRSTRSAADNRLPSDCMVLGVYANGQSRAYPLAGLEKAEIIQDSIADGSRLVFWYGPTKTAAAYLPIALPPEKQIALPRTLTFAVDPQRTETPFVDQETKSSWDVAGRAVEGELKGWTLSWLDGTQVKWFAWAAEHPDTSIHERRKTTSQPASIPARRDPRIEF